MARFIDLSEQDKIQYIKDGFVLILEQLAKDPSRLNNYIKLDAPKLLVPALDQIKNEMTEDQKTKLQDKNKLAIANAEAKNVKLEAEFKLKTEAYKKIYDIASKLKKKDGCLCGSCISIDIINNVLPQEFDMLIDVARKEAEERSY